MNTTLAASKQSYLLRFLKPQTSTNHPSLPRYICAEAHHSPPPQPPPPPLEEPSLVAQIVTQLESKDDDWNTNNNLCQLLFSSPDPLSPFSFFRITRQLGTTTKALRFFHFIRNNAPSPPNPLSLSSTFQAIFEFASREQPNSPANLNQLLSLSKDLNIPLTASSVTLLVKYFYRAGKIEKSLLVYNELNPDSKNTHVNNEVLNVLLRSDRVDDALHMLDEMLKPDAKFPPNNSTMNIVFEVLLKRNWSRKSVSEEKILRLVSKFGKHGVFPSTAWLTQLITKFCRSGESSKAWDLLHDMMKLGKVEAASFNALLSGLGRERDYQRINLLLKEMKENNIQPNVVTFGLLINHLCKSHRVDEALDVFKKMREGTDGISVKPDVILYNTLIDGLCKVGRQEEGLVLMEQMKSQSHCMPNTVTYNCLIDGFCKSGEIERSHELFDQMNKEGVEPNVITLNTLVDGMCKHGRIGNAMDFFRAMQENGLKGNAITYSALISAFCNANNIGKAMKLFDEMLESGCSPDAIVYYTLISGLTLAGRMDDASFVASKMKEAGFCLDVVSYNTLIGGFCRRKKFDRAVEILTDMEQTGIKPDGITYNTLISYFSENGDFETAHRIMKRMIDDGHVPTVVTFGAMIHAYCLAGQLDEAMKLFWQMGSASKVPPNTVIYNILIDSLCMNKKVEVALSVMDNMKRKGVRPSTSTYNAMLKGLYNKNWLEEALKLMDEMTEQACNPDYITMEILTDWLSEVGEIEKLRKFVLGYEVSASTP